MKSAFTAATVTAAAVALTGCATMIRGTSTEFVVVTDPPGARVTTDLLTRDAKIAAKKHSRDDGDPATAPTPEYRGCDATPCSFKVSRRANFRVQINSPGFHPVTVLATSGYGNGGPASGVGGAALMATGGYLVYEGVIMAGLTAATLSLASTSAIAATASSAAAGAATGIGVVFLGVDLATGAMKSVHPNPLGIVLIPDSEPLPEGPLPMIETEEELEALKSRLGTNEDA